MAPDAEQPDKPGVPELRDGTVHPHAKDMPAVSPTAVEERGHLVVGIGASAGGLDAFKAFFSKMPPDSGLAFVLVQHLDPKYQSSLRAIVAGYTAMPVHLAKDGIEINPNQVYVIPPDAILTVERGLLHVTHPALAAARRTSINTFLTSLAEDQGENAIGIILSGFGSDGALGIAAIKEHGGLTLSQAEFDHHAKNGMPQSAAAGGFVDHVLSVDDMPSALLDYRHHRAISDTTKGPDGIRHDLSSQLITICAVLHSRLGRDFSQYKAGTLMRRIQRRMHVLQTNEVDHYIEQLRTLPHEAELLFRELLIAVTWFFRDTEAFGVLEVTVLPKIFADPGATEPVRAWVAGCATGEEAYSVAILLKEALARSGSRRPVQIFATDIDDRAIEIARAGLYPDTIASNLSAERLEQNFVKENGHFRVAKGLREMCLFSVHDLVMHPPFSRLDLVSCRNLLIYFNPQLQQRILRTFHYALRPGGHLFLGSSEGIAGQSRLFAPLDKRQRLYTRQKSAARLPTIAPPRPAERVSPPYRSVTPAQDGIDGLAARVMARYAPAFLVVDQQDEIVRFSGQTAKYLAPSTGVASLNLFKLLHTDLRAVVRAALRQAVTTGAPVRHDAVTINAEEQPATVNVIVEPLSNLGEGGLFVVGFQEGAAGLSIADHAVASVPSAVDERGVEALNRDLVTTRERLRNITEELEAANEELQSSNEEYLSVNEELQSSNEELETSKEELQSLNEELQTINAELNHRNDSLVRSNSDLANLFDSTAIATLFLDNDLRIRRFTPRLLDIFAVREGDEGRPITDIVTRLSRDGLGQDVRRVLRTLSPIHREVTVDESGSSYLMQVRPYRDLNNVIDGAVITFVDISDRKKHEQARSLLAAIVQSSQDAIISHDLTGTITSWNAGAEQLYGYSAVEAIGQSISMLLAEALPDDWLDIVTRLKQGERIAQFDSARVAKSGLSLEVAITISPIREGNGRIAGVSLVARDISERKAAEQKAALLLGELDHRVKNILAIVMAVVSQTLKTSSTPAAFAAEVEGRVSAIAKAHSLLTQAGQGEISLSAILVTELAPYNRGENRIVIEGPNIALTPRAGLALAMAIHELASNAAKYGALATTVGRLRVAWNILRNADTSAMELGWTETGGPAVQQPSRRGFGTTLIERTLTNELDAKVSRDFLMAGLHCRIEIPLTKEIGRLHAADEIEGQAR